MLNQLISTLTEGGLKRGQIITMKCLTQSSPSSNNDKALKLTLDKSHVKQNRQSSQ